MYFVYTCADYTCLLYVANYFQLLPYYKSGCATWQFHEYAEMQTIVGFMKDEHHSCDRVFSLAEQAALDENRAVAETGYNEFRTDFARRMNTLLNET